MAAPHGPEDKILKQLAKGESPHHPVAHQSRQHQEGFSAQSLERHQQKPRRCRNRRLASQEHESIGNKESGAKVFAESCHLGCQPVRVAPPTGIQNAVAGRSACSGSTPKHQPQVSRVSVRIGGESQVAGKVRLWRVWILGPCGFRQCCEYQRGGTRLASLSLRAYGPRKLMKITQSQDRNGPERR